MSVYLKRNFQLLYWAQFFSWFGSKLLIISYVAFIFRETASASSAALVFAVDWLTNLVVGLIVSQWIDRRNARNLIIWLNIAAAVLTLTFLGFTTPEWYAVAIVIIFARGLLNSSVNAARAKALVQFFTKEQTNLYAPIVNSSMPVATAAAGVVGIVILSSTSFATVIVVNAVTFLFAAALIFFVRPDENRVRESIASGQAMESKIKGVASAVSIIRRNKSMASAVFYLLLSVTVLQATYESLVSVISQVWFDKGPSGTAMFFMIEAIAAAMSLFIYQYFHQRGHVNEKNERLVSTGLAVGALLCYLAMLLGRGQLVVCCVFFVLMVLLNSGLWAHAFKMLIVAAPEEKVASVVGVQAAMGYSLMGVIALVFSAGLDHFGPEWTIAINVSISLLLIAIVKVRTKRPRTDVPAAEFAESSPGRIAELDRT